MKVLYLGSNEKKNVTKRTEQVWSNISWNEIENKMLKC